MTDIRQLCCEKARLRVSDSKIVCPRHASVEVRHRIAAIDTRAPEIGIPAIQPAQGATWSMNYAWPYGSHGDLGARERLIEWASKRRLTWSKKSRCFHALLFGSCAIRDCSVSDSRGVPLLNEVTGLGLDARWMDHVTLWERDKIPALLLSQPYTDASDVRDVLTLPGPQSALQVEILDRGWHTPAAAYLGFRLDERVSPAGSVPVCSSCRSRRSRHWQVHRTTLDWLCLSCWGGDPYDVPDGCEYKSGERREMRRWHALAVAFRGTASTDKEIAA